MKKFIVLITLMVSSLSFSQNILMEHSTKLAKDTCARMPYSNVINIPGSFYTCMNFGMFMNHIKNYSGVDHLIIRKDSRDCFTRNHRGDDYTIKINVNEFLATHSGFTGLDLYRNFGIIWMYIPEYDGPGKGRAFMVKYNTDLGPKFMAIRFSSWKKKFTYFGSNESLEALRADLNEFYADVN